MDKKETFDYKMPLTLEEHLYNLSTVYSRVKEVYNLWEILKKRIGEELTNSRFVFATYSLHDESHSQTIIQTIERFLGEVRIRQLSATDTFMLLICAYVHDYGMSQSINRIYEILGSDDFENYLKENHKQKKELEEEDAWAIDNLMKILNNEKETVSIKDLYYSIVIAIQTYLRPYHWQGVTDIENDFKGLFQTYLKRRFVEGMEGIASICMCHGQDIKSIFKLAIRADGIVGDEFHPRFIAAMLRLGDLLDLDNGRFPMWFIKEIQKNNNMIPRLSMLNYWKHESIAHFLVTPKRIEITAECSSECGGYEVAALVSDWTDWLSNECRELVLHWNDIVQPDFGRPPGNLNIKIFVDGYIYKSENKNLQMKMSQEKLMKLLEGTNIYRDRYVGIREMLQNAVDASLLQLWKDVLQNRYTMYGLSKDTVDSDMDVLELLVKNRAVIFGNYNIKVEVIKDRKNKKIYVIIKDKGIGISLDDIRYVSELGSSKENNKNIKDIIDKMPGWLRPSGAFGIGLQSVFQLTDCIDFYTRQPNTLEQQISLYSYGKNKGKIEVREVPQNSDGLYYDNSVPGTNVKIAIDPARLLEKELLYYDREFDKEDDLDVAFAEVAQACEEKIRESTNEYFNVSFQTMECNGEKDQNPKKNPEKKLRKSYFYVNPNDKEGFGNGLRTLLNKIERKKNIDPYRFINNKAYYWSKESQCFYTWTLRPCTIEERIENGNSIKQIYLPEKTSDLYRASYKFNKILNVETIYDHYRRREVVHAGFLSLDILILDDDTSKYLTIDRERLKENAISEDALMKMRKEILEKWCSSLCDDKSKNNIKEKGSQRERKGNLEAGVLISLMLLFYQNVPSALFKKFKNKYQCIITEKRIVLGSDQIPIEYLWSSNKVFRSCTEKNTIIDKEEIDKNSENPIEMTMDTVRNLPHRLINIQRIKYDEAEGFVYYFSFRRDDDRKAYISMDEYARRVDYFASFDENSDGSIFKKGVDYHSIQKKLFKPDSEFKTLVVFKYPHTFRRGRNFSISMDYCIRSYILSPFDQSATDKLRLSIKNNQGDVSGFVEYVMQSDQMKKCLDYILNCKYGGNKERKLEIIDEYKKFVTGFYDIVFTNREELKNMFKDIH